MQEALKAYGEAEREEKRKLKQRVLAGEDLATEERARLEELKVSPYLKRLLSFCYRYQLTPQTYPSVVALLSLALMRSTETEQSKEGC